MDNLQLYGLDPADPSGSLCTCMRELVENALDAVGTNSAHTDLALIQRESTHVVEAAQHRSLSISLEPQDGMGSQWKLRVVDDGTGFADSALSSLSILFANGHSTALATPMNASSSLHGGVHVADLDGARAGAFGIGLKSVLHLRTSRQPSSPHGLSERYAITDRMVQGLRTRPLTNRKRGRSMTWMALAVATGGDCHRHRVLARAHEPQKESLKRRLLSGSINDNVPRAAERRWGTV